MPERHTRRRPIVWSAAVAAGLLLLAGCGSKDQPAAQTGQSPTTAAGSGSSAGSTPGSTAKPAGAARPSAGCGASAMGKTVQVEKTLTVNGTPRRYLLTVPSAHDGTKPLPVVFDFHGLMEGAEVHAGMSQYSVLAEEEGFIAVFPHGTGQPVRWAANLAAAEPNQDLVYFDAVLAELERDLCVDEARIYSTGLSNGAMFTSVLMCERADVLAAAAPIAGLTDSDRCKPTRPVPFMTVHGTADPILMFNGAIGKITNTGDGVGPTATPEPDLNGPGYPAAAAAFAKRNGCDPTPTDTKTTDEIIHRVYDCPDGADAEFYIVVGGGHSWPSSEFSKSIVNVVGPTTTDIDATRDAWEFMKQFTSPG